MRLSAGLELHAGGRIVRVRLVSRWMLRRLWFAGALWLAVGPLRVLVHTRRVYWVEP